MTVKIPSWEEKLAIARLKQGDLDGMEALVKHHQVRAVSAAYLIVRDPLLAEDIVQEAFLRAAERIDQFDESRPFGPWFLRSVINASIKAVRKQKRLIPLDGTQEEEVSKTADWLIDPDPSPELMIETQEIHQMVWKALGELSPEQRAVVIMRHFLEMSETEMTQKLERPLTTIRWRLKTARKQLRQFLELFWKQEYQKRQDEQQG